MEQNLTRIFTLFGGLALFLYGMDALSHSLETAAGSRLKSLLAAVTGSPVPAEPAAMEQQAAPVIDAGD